jgi:hypothetical protein
VSPNDLDACWVARWEQAPGWRAHATPRRAEASHSPLQFRVHSRKRCVGGCGVWTHQVRSGRFRRTTVNDQRMLVRGRGETSSVRDPPPSQSVSPSSRLTRAAPPYGRTNSPTKCESSTAPYLQREDPFEALRSVSAGAPTSSQAPVERISRVNPPFGFRVRPVSGEIPPCGPSHARNIGRMADS